jgi:hypothetical protein
MYKNLNVLVAEIVKKLSDPENIDPALSVLKSHRMEATSHYAKKHVAS